VNTKRIKAIVPIDVLDSLEKHLRECGVPGVTVESVQGYGRHPNFFSRNLMKNNARVVLYADVGRVDRIVTVIVTCARECGSLAGILAVDDIERLIDLTDGSDIESDWLSA